MRITDVRATALRVPSQRPEEPGIWGSVAQVFIEVQTQDGLTGIGEAFAYGIPLAAAAIVNDTLAPMLIGQDARQITPLTELMFRRTHLFGRYGVTTFAIGGVETALWDLAGKRADKPLYELLGGAADREVCAYASLIRHPEDDARIAEEARRAVDEGYTMVKLHQNAPSSVALARDAVGPQVPITVDINCEWTAHEAVGMARAMEPYDLLWLEEPVWPPEDFEGLAQVQAQSGVALASGENLCTVRQFSDLMAAGAVTYAQPSVTKVGGIGEFLKVAQQCALQGYELAPHSPYFGPGFVATLHLIAHTAQARWIEKIYIDLAAELFTEPLTFAGGTYTVPDGPGLGVELNPDLLADYRLDG